MTVFNINKSLEKHTAVESWERVPGGHGRKLSEWYTKCR
jgi:hypothetical protein